MNTAKHNAWLSVGAQVHFGYLANSPSLVPVTLTTLRAKNVAVEQDGKREKVLPTGENIASHYRMPVTMSVAQQSQTLISTAI